MNEVTRERAFSFLTDDHINRIATAYNTFADEDGFACVVSIDDVLQQDANLNIPLYVRPQALAGGHRRVASEFGRPASLDGYAVRDAE